MQRDIDTLSLGSNAYVARSKLNRGKSATVSQRSTMSQNHNLNSKYNSNTKQSHSTMKVYIPTDYYKHAGYIPKESGPKSRLTQSTTKSLIGERDGLNNKGGN